MAFKENYSHIDRDWAIKEANDPMRIWTHNRSKTECIDNYVNIAKLGGLVVGRSINWYSPSEIQRIAEYGPLVDLAFGEKAYLTSSLELETAAIVRGGTSDPIYTDLRKIDSTHGFDMRWAIPVRAMLPVIDLTDIDQTSPYHIPDIQLGANA